MLKRFSGSKWFGVMLAVLAVVGLSSVVWAIPNTNPAVGNTTVRGDGFHIRFNNTSVRHDNSRRVGDHHVVLSNSGAMVFTRVADEARQLGNWTWLRGRLTGTTAQRTGVRPNGTTATIGQSVTIHT